MDRRVFLNGLLASALSLSVREAMAQNRSQDDGYSKTIAWFTSLFQPISKLADEIDRIRLVHYLQGLELACDGILQEKEDVIILLTGAHPIDRARLGKSLDDLIDDVSEARRSLTRVASVIRESYRKGADDAEAELSMVLSERKGWASVAKSSLNNHSDEELIERFLPPARESRDGLTGANKKLGELVVYLKKQVAS